jgi:hypothetical protein
MRFFKYYLAEQLPFNHPQYLNPLLLLTFYYTILVLFVFLILRKNKKYIYNSNKIKKKFFSKSHRSEILHEIPYKQRATLKMYVSTVLSLYVK